MTPFEEGRAAAANDLKQWKETGAASLQDECVALLVKQVDELKYAHTKSLAASTDENRAFWQRQMQFCFGYIAAVAERGIADYLETVE
jgi:hypothetical protein